MIFVTLGTNDKSFERLLKAVETACEKGQITDRVLVQSGFTRYSSPYFEVKESMDQTVFRKTLEEADLVITHGGVGTIMTALQLKKKILAAARLEKYHEHVNDHQIQLLEAFEKDGYLIYMKDLEDISGYLEAVKNFEPKEYRSNTDAFVSFLEEWIEKN